MKLSPQQVSGNCFHPAYHLSIGAEGNSVLGKEITNLRNKKQEEGAVKLRSSKLLTSSMVKSPNTKQPSIKQFLGMSCGRMSLKSPPVLVMRTSLEAPP